MLLLMGGLIYWKLSGDEETTPPPPPPVATTTAPKVFDEPPPPPPPPDEPEADAGAPKQTKRGGVASTGGGCGGPCNGQASGTLKAQLGAKASQARACYERALRQNAHLQGRMRLSVRIGPAGNVCSASITSSELGDPGVASCVVQIFRSSSFAAPQGGCVDAEVPMRFEPKT
jgi:TonB family protein